MTTIPLVIQKHSSHEPSRKWLIVNIRHARRAILAVPGLAFHSQQPMFDYNAGLREAA